MALAVGRVLVRRPRLAPAFVRSALRLAPRQWWKQWPPLPLPDPDYLRFRTVTAYGGDGSQAPDAADVEAWLAWVRTFPHGS